MHNNGLSNNGLNSDKVSISRVLRGLGASGRLTGFNYTVYIVHNVLQNPEEHHWLTKCEYPKAAKHFGVGPASVEHAIRTLIASCWARSDHTGFDRIAGYHVETMPTNSFFIDMLAAYMRYGSCSDNNF